MADPGVPIGFDAWVKFCFNPSRKEYSLQSLQFWEPPPDELANWLIRLFNDAPKLLAGIHPYAIADGIWFVFGGVSSYLGAVRGPDVCLEKQIRVVDSIRNIYRDFFDRVGDSFGTRLPDSTNSFGRLDGAIYMIWDMDTLEYGAMSDKTPHLVEPALAVLDTALRCKTVTCQISGLHGLGHLYRFHPERVIDIIHRFQGSGHARLPWVAEYAAQAIRGRVL